jgi:hypothetical protein
MMKLKDMKAFAALTDEERATAIRREEYRLEAIKAYEEEWFKDHKGKINCGCGVPYWTVDAEGQQALNICFTSDGEIGSDMWESVFVSNLYCINCNGKPKVPQWFINEFTEELMGE